jgi:diguanylate cyclase (GGDEF)-like protein/PAS domain S-box-containing protein
VAFEAIETNMFQPYGDVVFLVYGLAFLAMGLVIVIRRERESRLELGKVLWLLAAFGFSHGFLEWMDLWRVVRGDNPGLAAARPPMLLLSYLFLFEFGRRVVLISLSPAARARPAGRLLGPWIHVPILGGILAVTLASDQSELAMTIWSRYLPGFFGSVLAGAGFHLYWRNQLRPTMSSLDLRAVRLGCQVAGAAFIAYAVLGGLVVPQADWLPASAINQETFVAVLGVPVQLPRAICAALIAISVGVLLRIFHLEGLHRQRATEQRLALSLKGSDLAMTDWHIPSDVLVLGEGWTKLLGYRVDELQPRATALAGLLNAEDALAARDALVRHLKGETPFLEAEVRLRHKDGRWIWVLARGMAVERAADGRALRVAGTAMDISARKRAEAEVARLSQWNELLLNSAGEGIYGVDRQGVCTFINPVALALLGFDKEEVLGQKQHLLFHHHHKDGSPYPETECPIYRTLRDGIRRETEDAFIRKNGQVFPVQLTVTPMHENGQIVGVEAVFQDIGRRKEMEQELMRLATTDPLTGAANRRHFLEQLEMELERIKRFGKPAAFLMVDLDHFKNVNDTYGHAVGDAVLRHFADLVRLRLRRVDLFGRLGGEEFGILLPGTDRADALQFAERFRAYVADTPVQCSKGTLHFTISIGIAEFDPADADAPDGILARADVALYRAKAGGRNAVELFAGTAVATKAIVDTA